MKLNLPCALRSALLLCLALASALPAAHADEYVWTGADANNPGRWDASGNWKVGGSPNGYYPQSNKDSAVIGEDAGTITWATGSGGANLTNVQVASGSTLLLDRTSEFQYVNVQKFELTGGDVDFRLGGSSAGRIAAGNIILGAGSTFSVSSEAAHALEFYAPGSPGVMNLSFGTFTADGHGSFVAGEHITVHFNANTLVCSGTLDASLLTGAGTIELVSFADVDYGAKAVEQSWDLSGLTATGLRNAASTVSVAVSEDGKRLVVAYDMKAAEVVWAGGSGTWVAEGGGWTSEGKAVAYLDGDTAVFGANGALETISLSGDLRPGAVEVHGTYAFDSSGGSLETQRLDGDAAASISGTLTVTGGDRRGSYLGSYGAAGATVTVAGGSQKLAAGGTLSVVGTGGKLILAYPAAGGASEGALKGITASQTEVELENVQGGQVEGLQIQEASSLTGGTLSFGVNAADILGGTVPTILSGGQLTLSGVEIIAVQQDAVYTFDTAPAPGTVELFRLSDSLADGSTAKVTLSGGLLGRFFRDARLGQDGMVVAELVSDFYAGTLGRTENGRAGLGMLDQSILMLNPQGQAGQYADLAAVLDELDEYAEGGHAAEGDKLAAAVAGVGVASLGMALSGDMERQLRAIRNRTTTMGVNPGVWNADMPYFNVWLNAEGDYRKMDAEGTVAGYEFTSWGGTVGFDIDASDALTFGLAVTAMHGDFSAESADAAEADVETCYLSAFARVAHDAWVHTFVAACGMSSSSIGRRVGHGHGGYSTQGEADGSSWGLLYEAARTFTLDEDASACLQPLFNVAYRHVEVDAYTESGSDAALRFGEQSLDTLSFGLGARLQAVVGESIFNRTTIFEARALAKLDAGDRQGGVEGTLCALGAASGRVKSAEAGAFGAEVGLGLTVPISAESSSLFIEASAEFRSREVNANAAAGYRVNF